jgi:transporter family-2 protein
MDAAARKRRTLPLAVLGAVACGAGVATQSRINGQLGAELSDGYVAAVISFGSGLLILSILMIVFKGGRVGLEKELTAIKNREIPWWYAIGGAAGGLFVLTQGLTSAALGVALFSIGTVSGQTVSGVLVDRIGLGHVEPRLLSARRLLGAGLALVAVAVAASSQFGEGANAWLLLFPFVAGLALAWQQGVNGQIRRVSGSVLTATFGNFVVGTVVLLAAAIVHTLIVGWPTTLPANPVLYLGGSLGVLFIGLGAAVVGVTGVLLLTLGTISGQLLASLALDLALPVAGHGVQWTTVAGIALALVAVVIVATAKSRTPQR